MAQQLPLIEARLAETSEPAVTRPAPAAAARSQAGRTGDRPARPARSRAARAWASTGDRSGALVEIPPADWRIDAHTKEVGLAGIAAARQALAAAVGRGSHPMGDRSAA